MRNINEKFWGYRKNVFTNINLVKCKDFMETCVFLLGIEATSKRLFDLQFVFYRAVKKTSLTT